MRLIRPHSRGVVAAIAAAAVLGVGGAVVAATQFRSTSGSTPASVSDGGTAPGTPPEVRVAGLRNGQVPWNHKLTLVAANGTFSSVSVRDRGDTLVDGVMSADGARWTSSMRLVPSSRYVANVVVAASDSSV